MNIVSCCHNLNLFKYLYKNSIISEFPLCLILKFVCILFLYFLNNNNNLWSYKVIHSNIYKMSLKSAIIIDKLKNHIKNLDKNAKTFDGRIQINLKANDIVVKTISKF